MLALVSDRVWVEGEMIAAAVLIDKRQGIIVDVVSDIPGDHEVWDAGDKVVTPGLIDAHSHMGLVEIGGGEMGDDRNERGGTVWPQLRAVDGINPCDSAFSDAVSGGVTAVCIMPGARNVVGGQAACLRLRGKTVSDMVVKEYCGMKCAVGQAPKTGKDGISPQTKMAVIAELRSALADGQRDDWNAVAWQRVFSGCVPLRVHAHRVHDMESVLELAQEFGVRVVFEHATEAVELIDTLVQTKTQVVCTPYFRSPGWSEELGMRSDLPAVLADSGVGVAIATDFPRLPPGYLKSVMALAVRYGMDMTAAMASVTTVPAKILGVDDTVGQLKRGLKADIVVWDDVPWRWGADVYASLIDGKVVGGNCHDRA